jgi:N-ethylmaleimide reductase
VRLSPSGKFLSMSDSNPEATFDYVAEQLNRFDLAYLHIIEPRVNGSELIAEGQAPVASARLRRFFNGTMIAAGGFDADDAQAAIARGEVDLVAFGRDFIANPDLPKRLQNGLPLNQYDRDTFYGGSEKGYTDYPFHEGAENG